MDEVSPAAMPRINLLMLFTVAIGVTRLGEAVENPAMVSEFPSRPLGDELVFAIPVIDVAERLVGRFAAFRRALVDRFVNVARDVPRTMLQV